jgi:hypothetical protein
MPGIPRDERQIDLAANVCEQVLPEHSEQGPKEHDQHHADAEGVQHAGFRTDEHRIDKMLHEVGCRNAEQRHQDRTGDRFEKHGLMHSQQAEESSQRLNGGFWFFGLLNRGIGGHQQQVAGPQLRECFAAHPFNAAGGIGNDNAAGIDLMQYDEVAVAFFGFEMSDRRERRSHEGFVRTFNGLCGESDPLGCLHESEKIRADLVGSRQVSHRLQAEVHSVMTGDGGESRRSAVAPVSLPTQYRLSMIVPAAGCFLRGWRTSTAGFAFRQWSMG